MKRRSLLLAMFAPQCSISGNVWDPQGAAIADAEVAVTGAAQGKVWTNQNGFYKLANLPAGEYAIAVTHASFERHREKGIVLREGQSRQIDVQLEMIA